MRSLNCALRQRAYTMIEMIVSTSILSLITVGIGSVMLLAARALPDANSPMQAVMDSSTAVERLCSDLPYATSVPSRSSTGINFTVADRDNDLREETFAYAWSGNPGDPLTLQMNGQTPFTLLSKVEQLSLTYETTTHTTTTPVGNESSEVLHNSHNAVWDLKDYTITANNWVGQFFKPTLPADALGWSIQRVEFYAKTAGPVNGQSKIQLQAATSGQWPSGQVYEEKLLNESSLWYGYLLQSFTFSTVTDLDPDQGVCLVIRHVTNAEACRIQAHQNAVGLSDTHLIKTANAGASWSAPSNESLIFWVFGTVTTAGAPQVETTQYLTAINLKLNTGVHDETLIQTSIPVLNRPLVNP